MSIFNVLISGNGVGQSSLGIELKDFLSIGKFHLPDLTFEKLPNIKAR